MTQIPPVEVPSGPSEASETVRSHSTPTSPDPEPSGRTVILWLFVALSAATAAILLYFATLVEPQYQPRIYVALVGDLGIPLIAWQLFRLIEEKRAASET